jgi:hypothetical protein
MMDEGTKPIPDQSVDMSIAPQFQEPPVTASPGALTHLQNYLASKPQRPTAAPSQPQWNKAAPYSQLGTAIGSIGRGAINGTLPWMNASSGTKPQLPTQNTPQEPTASYDMGDGADMISGATPSADGRMPYLAAGHMPSGFHWRIPHTPQPHVPAGGYQPLDYRPKPMLANGQKPQIMTSPTRVHLAPNDMVVPLTYRPKAKVRPSAVFGGSGA